jgi:hypothetical protein
MSKVGKCSTTSSIREPRAVVTTLISAMRPKSSGIDCWETFLRWLGVGYYVKLYILQCLETPELRYNLMHSIPAAVTFIGWHGGHVYVEGLGQCDNYSWTRCRGWVAGQQQNLSHYERPSVSQLVFPWRWVLHISIWVSYNYQTFELWFVELKL